MALAIVLGALDVTGVLPVRTAMRYLDRLAELLVLVLVVAAVIACLWWLRAIRRARRSSSCRYDR